MKRDVKIKALPVLVAWCVIFAHSIIPHYHVEEHYCGCHEIIHVTCNIIDSAPDFKYHSPHSENRVCHFAGLVFHNLQTDTLFYPDNSENIFILLNTQKIIFSDKSARFISETGLGTNTLRAPPAS